MRSFAGRGRGLAGTAVLVGSLALACQTPSDDGGDPTSDGGEEEETFPLPRIVVPANNNITITVSETEPLELVVAGVVPGVTEVVLGGRVLGTLPAGSPFGELRADSLTLRLAGAMIVGSRTLTLVNPGEDGPLSSRALTISLVTSAVPVNSVEPGPMIAEGQTVTVVGAFADALLTVVDEVGEEGVALAHVFRRDGAGWGVSPRTVALPGYARGSTELAPPVTAGWGSRADEEGGVDVLRLAWRVGQDGPEVLGAEVLWDDGASAQPQSLMVAPAPFSAPYEWVGYGRPRFHGRDLLVEATTLLDSELSHPGDHRLLQLHWPSPPEGPGVLFEVTTPEVADLDALGPAASLLDRDKPLHALRIGGVDPGLVELDSSGGARVLFEEDGVGLALAADVPVEVLGIASSLGVWSTFAIDAKGAYALSLVDTYAPASSFVVTPLMKPETLPTGAPALAILGGVPHIAVPYGDEDVVHIATIDGGPLRLDPLPGVHCDALALLTEDPAALEAPLVCASAGEVRADVLVANYSL